MNTYTQKINQTENGLEVVNMVNGRPDPCSDCWQPCQGCQKKPRSEESATTSDTYPGILDGIDWEL